MKHALKITLILLSMFVVTQLIGLFVISNYSPSVTQVVNSSGEIVNVTSYNLPYGMDPPSNVEPRGIKDIAISFAIVFTIAVLLMLFLMKFNLDLIIRLWFFVVVILAIGISVNSILQGIPNSSFYALALALPLAFYKIFKRNLLVHNLTELIIYPGIAAIFIALLMSWTRSPIPAVVVILVLISLYDMYAVWHAGFMQKMAQYQIKNLKLFTGFFVPYVGKKEKHVLLQNEKSKKKKKVKVSVAILGGGDVVFPIILAGVVYHAFGILPSLMITLGATLALTALFWISEKGKFYPAMPFISAGCFLALGAVYLLF